MGISKRTLETLIDLVEIKLSCMEVAAKSGAVVAFPQAAAKGRRVAV
jgi:hypothetical protein